MMFPRTESDTPLSQSLLEIIKLSQKKMAISDVSVWKNSAGAPYVEEF